LAITQGDLKREKDHRLKLLLIGYGVGLSWASVLLDLPPSAFLKHSELDAGK
jgi:hypothetical protein